MQAALKAGLFYAGWYPKQWLPASTSVRSDHPLAPVLKRHLRYATRTSRRLARRLFHAMAKFGPKLEREQVLLGRFVDIGTELFAIAATCSRAHSLCATGTREENEALLKLVDYFCASARLRIEQRFAGLKHNADSKGYKLAQQVLTSTPKVL